MTTSAVVPGWLLPAITPVEAAVVDLVSRRFGISNPVVLAATALAVLAPREGHACVDLEHLSELIEMSLPSDTGQFDLSGIPDEGVIATDLRQHPEVVQVVESDLDEALDMAREVPVPFVLWGSYLYTQRQFVDELSIAQQIAMRSRLIAPDIVDDSLIDRIVPKPGLDDKVAISAGDTGIANRAAKSFISRRLTVLTGGPGTGKTFTLTRCLAALLATSERRSSMPRLALVAPTGKAATRAKDLLAEFVASQRVAGEESLGLSAEVLEQLDRIEPRTIHRILGSKGNHRTRFAHDESRPLDVDVVIVDEMSMVPSALMARLLEALRLDTTILLVGDQAQLEAVESGSVLREIVEFGQSLDPSECFAFELRRVWRQNNQTKIGDFAREIRAGRAVSAVNLVVPSSPGIELMESVGDADDRDSPLGRYVAALKEVRFLAESTDVESHRRAYEIASNNKFLCGPRRGKCGIDHWNNVIHEKVIGSTDRSVFEPGVPLLVTVNSARSRLVNGDVGLVVNTASPDGSINRAVYFMNPASARYLSLAQLPSVEICFAMTVHKSQGSEYDYVTVVIPGNDSSLLHRELIYTAVTRAKRSLTIVGASDQLSEAINNRSTRFSALASMIRELSFGCE